MAVPSLQESQEQDDAYMKQAADAAAAQKTQDALQGGDKPQPSFLQKWVTGPIGRVTTNTIDSAVSAADAIYDTEGMHKARDATAGAITGAVNTADAAVSAGKFMETGGVGMPPSSPIWDHAKASILDFRDAVAVQDPTMADGLVQGVAQLAVPFAGYSRALAGLHGIANMAVAGGVTDATALAPHDMRMADLLALGRHTEGKLGDALRTLAPDGSALNAYVNFLTDRGNETEAEGRFKNVLDGFGVNMIATPLIHAAGVVLKQGYAGLRYAVENGVGSAGDLAPPSAAAQRGGPAAAQATPDRGLRLVQQLHANDHVQGEGVQYGVNGDMHTATSDNGVTVAIPQGKNLRVLSSETWAGRGQGEGTARMERLVQEAQAKGLTLTSDSEVSEPAQKVYERLRKLGYDVKENPSRIDPGTGVKHSTSELKGVYEVRPRSKEMSGA